MFYTGINPVDMKPVHVVTDYHEKQLQRALLQYNRPENADLVREALTKAGRTDLIGFGPECLVRPAGGRPSAGKPDSRRGEHHPNTKPAPKGDRKPTASGKPGTGGKPHNSGRPAAKDGKKSPKTNGRGRR